MRTFPQRSPEDEDASDAALSQFLRHHRPPVPAAAPDLEDRIMDLLNDPSMAMGDMAESRTSRLRARSRWLVPITLAASLVAGWCSYQVLLPTPTPDPEVASLESFIDSAWSVPTDNPEAEARFVSQLLIEPATATDP
jgi:hypothetical protein